MTRLDISSQKKKSLTLMWHYSFYFQEMWREVSHMGHTRGYNIKDFFLFRFVQCPSCKPLRNYACVDLCHHSVRDMKANIWKLFKILFAAKEIKLCGRNETRVLKVVRSKWYVDSLLWNVFAYILIRSPVKLIQVTFYK